jgi:hypothetical protein
VAMNPSEADRSNIPLVISRHHFYDPISEWPEEIFFEPKIGGSALARIHSKGCMAFRRRRLSQRLAPALLFRHVEGDGDVGPFGLVPSLACVFRRHFRKIGARLASKGRGFEDAAT